MRHTTARGENLVVTITVKKVKSEFKFLSNGSQKIAFYMCDWGSLIIGVPYKVLVHQVTNLIWGLINYRTDHRFVWNNLIVLVWVSSYGWMWDLKKGRTMLRTSFCVSFSTLAADNSYSRFIQLWQSKREVSYSRLEMKRCRINFYRWS